MVPTRIMAVAALASANVGINSRTSMLIWATGRQENRSTGLTTMETTVRRIADGRHHYSRIETRNERRRPNEKARCYFGLGCPRTRVQLPRHAAHGGGDCQVRPLRRQGSRSGLILDDDRAGGGQ